MLKFIRDDRGAALIYISLCLPVFMGLGLLAIDGSRIFNMQTELQKAADSLALAGAAELDASPTAITRAQSAINTMVFNEQRMESSTRVISTAQVTVRFLKEIPLDDNFPIVEADHRTTDPTKAQYVEVRVNPITYNTIMPAAFFGLSRTSTTSATAVAGFTMAVCKTMPMFICNPFENTGIGLFDSGALGRQIKMQLGGGGSAQYFPGNYGWLDTPSFSGGNGANVLRDALARVSPPICFDSRGVTVRTGNIENANNAINVRFDLWEGPFNGDRNNADYRPAQNVRKGYAPATKGGNPECSPNPTPTTPNNGRLPRDADFTAGDGRLGDGVWDFDQYWSTNYGGFASAPNSWSNSNRPSRYQVYRHELSTIGTGTDLVAHQSAAPYNESGRPLCQGNTGLSDQPDRRLIYAAIVDCRDLDVHGNTSTPLPVVAFGKFFLTEPVPGNPSAEAGTIYSEFVEVIRPGNVSNDVVKDQVQLYR